MRTISVVIVEDHPRLRQVVRHFVQQAAGLEVVAAVASAEEAFTVVRARAPDIALVDVSLPGESGLALIRRLKASLPQLRCVVLSAQSGAYHRQAAARVGADGYVSKLEPEQLVPTLRQVMAHEVGDAPRLRL